jgi:phosphoribosylanthranilate isomerase
MLRTKILAGSITNLTDARYFAAMGVEWMGFNLNPGDDSFMPPVQVQAIKEWVEGPAILGKFNMQSAEEIQKLSTDLDLDAIQIGMFTEVETLRAVETSLPVIKEIVLEKGLSREQLEETLQSFAPYVQYFLLDFAKNNWRLEDLEEHAVIHWAYIQQLCESYPVLLHLGFPAGQILDLMEDLEPAGLKVLGGEEEKVGYKSFDELDELLEGLEEEN